MVKSQPGKWLLISGGMVSVGLGVIGIIVPLLPTTPFLLLAAACFIRSSERLYQWLMFHRTFGSYIRNYREHKAITIKTKVVSLVFLWATIGYSALIAVDSWILRCLLFGIAVGVTIHLLHLKTMTKEMQEQMEKELQQPRH